MKKVVATFIAMFASLSCFAADYTAGQVWSYKTRPGEEASVLTILKVDSDKAWRQIIHIRLDGLRVRKVDGSIIEYIAHMPFAKTAIDKSVTKLLRTEAEVPDFSRGYDAWKQAKAAPMKEPINEVVEGLAQQLAK
ncbi:MAG: hypothetical protein LBU53_05495 [Zoogloeaceae bacterium]|jgi:hypothetical protein|nr:hypothetical protein [Zoogloeaceae bacterium]